MHEVTPCGLGPRCARGIYVLPRESLHIFDPPPELPVAGFGGCVAATTIRAATETGVSTVGVFQAAYTRCVVLTDCLRGDFGP